MPLTYDVAVIGGGHNGLTAAAYLAGAGLRVGLFERREVLGGACVTEELWPGVRANTAAYVVSLLDDSVRRDLQLDKHGLELLPRNPSSFTPLPDGEGLLLGPDMSQNVRELSRFSPADAARFPEYCHRLERIAAVVERIASQPAPDPLAGGASAYLQSFGLYRSIRALAAPDAYAATELLLGSAGRFLEQWFRWQPLQATLATDGIIGAMASPYTPGTGMLLLHHVMGRAGGARGVWAYVRGGMGRLSDAIARAAKDRGADLYTNASVHRLLRKGERVVGLQLEDGRDVQATAVLAGCDVRTATRLAGDDAPWPEDFLRHIETLDFRSPVCKLNLLCDGLPVFRGLGGDGHRPGPEHRGTIHICPDMQYMHEAYVAAESGAPAHRPVLELTIQSAVDPTLAPEGKHVISAFTQFVPPRWADNKPDPAEVDSYVKACLEMLDEFAPGFSSRVVEIDVLGPDRLQQVFGLTGGNIFHGAMKPDQMLFLRPAPGWAHYRLPLVGYYLCGSSAHPGGGVTGLPGKLAAMTVLRDWRRLRRFQGQ